MYKSHPFHDKMFVNVTQGKCVHRLHLVHKCSSIREEDEYVSNLNQGYRDDGASSMVCGLKTPLGPLELSRPGWRPSALGRHL